MVFWISAALLTALCVTFTWQALFAHLRTRSAKAIALLVAIALPLTALSLYWRTGSVGMPDIPTETTLPSKTRYQSKWMAERPLISELRVNPKNEDAWVQLISVYVETDRMPQARQAYKDAILSVAQPTKLKDPEFRKMLGVEDVDPCPAPKKC